MDNIMKIFQSKEDSLLGKGSSENSILQAEEALSVSFSADYKEYLLTIGIAAYDGHELTGISDSKRVNVVDVTRTERRYNPEISDDWYVIEETNIDGIAIWQSETGDIFQSMPGAEAIWLCGSFREYLYLE